MPKPIAVVALAASLLGACVANVNTTALPQMASADIDAFPPSKVLSQSNVAPAVESWGEFYPYFTADTPATRNHLTGVAVIRPGQEIHPPHRHSEEEVLMVLEGEGTWSLLDEDFPAKTGDILYAKPWDIHGIRNTGTTDLRFVVVKYDPAGLTPPPDPNPDLGEYGR